MGFDLEEDDIYSHVMMEGEKWTTLRETNKVGIVIMRVKGTIGLWQ